MTGKLSDMVLTSEPYESMESDSGVTFRCNTKDRENKREIE
jgi:hypothetical protein